MPLHVHFTHPPDLDALRELCLPGITFTSDQDRVPPETELLVAGRPRAEHLAESPTLWALIVPFAGIPASTAALMQQHPHITVHNLHHNAAATAEMAMALLLAAAKTIVPVDRVFREHDWTPRYTTTPALTLAGRTALVLGYGAVGGHVAQICRGMGMDVIGVKRQIAADDYPDEVHAIDALHDLLPRADVLIVCLPHTPATDGLIGAAELALLPEHAILVNVGRGPIIDEAALYHALRDRRIHAAGLDVWYNYPASAEARANTPPANHPFHELDNVVMSPHRAGAGGTEDSERRRLTALADMLNTAAAGQPLPNRVDLNAGY